MHGGNINTDRGPGRKLVPVQPQRGAGGHLSPEGQGRDGAEAQALLDAGLRVPALVHVVAELAQFSLHPGLDGRVGADGREHRGRGRRGRLVARDEVEARHRRRVVRLPVRLLGRVLQQLRQHVRGGGFGRGRLLLLLLLLRREEGRGALLDDGLRYLLVGLAYLGFFLFFSLFGHQRERAKRKRGRG